MVTTETDRYVPILPDSFAETGYDTNSNEPPILSTIGPLHVVTDEHSLAPPELTPISIMPMDNTSTAGYSEHTEHPEESPEVGTTSSDTPDSASKSGPCMTSSPKHISASEYYEVLTPEGDDVIYINRKEIMSRNCSVTLENLSASDIKELQECTKILTESTSDNQSSSEQKTTSDTDWVPLPKKKVTSSNRPRKAPSRARLAAQKMISHNRKHPVRKRQTPVYPIARSKKPIKDTQPDSDETIIYEPPMKTTGKMSKPAKSSRGKAVFTIRTIGIKLAKDSELIISTQKRFFTCFLCGHKSGNTRDLNHHFKNTHDALKCTDCDKEYYSPLSLKKHQYMHKDLVFACGHCDQKFPFKSQRDGHERTHSDKTRHHCSRPNCTLSFRRLSDLKSHEAKHDQPPIKCQYCEYENVDKQNVKQHERTHTGEKPYQCNNCKQKFMFAVQRKRHKCEG